MHNLPIADLEARVAAYDPDTATRAEWTAHVAAVRELWNCQGQELHLLGPSPTAVGPSAMPWRMKRDGGTDLGPCQ